MHDDITQYSKQLHNAIYNPCTEINEGNFQGIMLWNLKSSCQISKHVKVLENGVLLFIFTNFLPLPPTLSVPNQQTGHNMSDRLELESPIFPGSTGWSIKHAGMKTVWHFYKSDGNTLMVVSGT